MSQGSAQDAALSNGAQRTRITNGITDATMEPFGALNVNISPMTLFYDAWSVSPIDTAVRWTVTGTAPTIANGNMQMSATPSTYNAIRTKDVLKPNAGFTLNRNGVTLETTAATGAGRFWGLGTPATTPSPTSLVQDGVGYEVDQATGALLAVTYAAGVRTTIATLNRPTDGLPHAYGLYFRVTSAVWVLDGVIVASRSFPNLIVVELPALIVRQNAASFTGTPVMTSIAFLTADTSRQGQAICDPIVGTRMARVTEVGALSVDAGTEFGGQARLGRAYTATSTRLTPTAGSAGANLLTIYNPVGSGKTVFIDRISVGGVFGNNVQGAFDRVRFTTAPTGGTAVTPVSRNSSATASTTTVLRANVTVGVITGVVVTGGVQEESVNFNGGGNDRNEVNGSLILPPGTGLSLQLTCAANAATSVAASFAWHEV